MNKAEQKRTTRHNRTKRVSKYAAKVYGTTDPETMTALGLDYRPPAPDADAHLNDADRKRYRSLKAHHDTELMDLATDIVQRDELNGICLECREETNFGTVEYDAEGYECESCGEPTVIGAQEYLLQYPW